jgi:hypothetical protein
VRERPPQLARVYATARQARAAFEREAVITTARCELKDIRPKPVVAGLRVRGLAARVRAFRGAVSPLVHADIVFLQRGHSVTRLQFVNAGLPESVEHAAEAKVVARLR